MAVIQELINYVIAYMAVLAIFFIGINILTKGYLLAYLRVKASRGALTLLRIYSAYDVYYRASKWSDGVLNWKSRGKESKSFPCKSADFKAFTKQEMGVNLIEIDEIGNKLIDKDFNIVKFVNIDPSRLNSLILMIKNRPVNMSKEMMILIIVCLAVLGVSVFVAFQIGEMREILETLQRVSGNI